MSYSDDELLAQLEAAMECAPAPNEPSKQEKADTTLARELQADEYNKTQPEDTTFPFLDLPEELQRRCLRHVSIANLLVNVFRVNKYLSIAAVQEVRERVQGQIQDALISGFDSDAAAAAEKAAEERFAAAENDGGSPSSSSAGASSSSSSATTTTASGGHHRSRHSPTEPMPEPQRRRLVALSHSLEAELLTYAASAEQGDRHRALTSKCRSLCFNLSDKANPELRGRLLCGELESHALVRLSSQAMASSSLRAQRDQWKTERMHFKIRPERTLGYRTDLYRCEGCGSRDTRVHRAIRAGRHQVDQARTYVTCCECSRRWEEGGM